MAAFSHWTRAQRFAAAIIASMCIFISPPASGQARLRCAR